MKAGRSGDKVYLAVFIDGHQSGFQYTLRVGATKDTENVVNGWRGEGTLSMAGGDRGHCQWLEGTGDIVNGWRGQGTLSMAGGDRGHCQWLEGRGHKAPFSTLFLCI